MESNDYNTNTTIKNTISTYIIPINFQLNKIPTVYFKSCDITNRR